jgi:hypothetical protein
MAFESISWGEQVTKPTRTIFGVVALFAQGAHGQFFLSDGTQIGPVHGSLAGAVHYGQRKGWKVEPLDAGEGKKNKAAVEQRAQAAVKPAGGARYGGLGKVVKSGKARGRRG